MDSNAIMKITCDGDVTIVGFTSNSISGIGGVEEVAKQLRAYISANKPQRIVVDFDRVSFFSSLMLGLLVDLWRRTKEYGGVMLISGIDPQLSRVFRITNLDKIFQFAADRQEAIEAISAIEL